MAFPVNTIFSVGVSNAGVSDLVAQPEDAAGNALGGNTAAGFSNAGKGRFPWVGSVPDGTKFVRAYSLGTPSIDSVRAVSPPDAAAATPENGSGDVIVTNAYPGAPSVIRSAGGLALDNVTVRAYTQLAWASGALPSFPPTTYTTAGGVFVRPLNLDAGTWTLTAYNPLTGQTDTRTLIVGPSAAAPATVWTLSPVPTPPTGYPIDPNQRVGTYTVIEPPTVSVVTVAQVRRQSRIDLDTEDPGGQGEYLTLLIAAAVEYAEKRLETSLAPRRIAATFYESAYPVRLPMGPVIAVESVTDALGVTAAFVTKAVGNSLQVITAASRPATITYRAGYVDLNGLPAIPNALKVAILTHVASLYENRESVSETEMMAVPHSLEMMYRAYSRGMMIR